MITHQNRFNAVSVTQFPQIFDCTILLGNLLSGNLRSRNETVFLQFFSQTLGEIGHVIERCNAFMQPSKHLLAAKSLLTHRLEQFGNLLKIHRFNINHKSSTCPLGTTTHQIVLDSFVMPFASYGRYRIRPCHAAGATGSTGHPSCRPVPAE